MELAERVAAKGHQERNEEEPSGLGLEKAMSDFKL